MPVTMVIKTMTTTQEQSCSKWVFLSAYQLMLRLPCVHVTRDCILQPRQMAAAEGQVNRSRRLQRWPRLDFSVHDAVSRSAMCLRTVPSAGSL